MRRREWRLLLIAFVVGTFAITPAYAQKNAGQVVFSTPGFFPMTLTGTSGDATPLGFWVGCIAEPGGTLSNAKKAQTKALTNTVHVECTFENALLAAGTGTADVTNSIVNVTGPK